MSFYETLQRFDGLYREKSAPRPSEGGILRAIDKETLSEDDLAVLLSQKAQAFLEPMARRAREITLRNFGKVIGLYAPLYIANHCVNECAYCGFKHSNAIERRKLSLEEIEREGRALAGTGIRHLLVLTGESRSESPLEYIAAAVRILKKYFPSISIEVYPLKTEEYALLAAEGVDGMTIYQETYDKELYASLHLRGPKRDYRFRLEAPERGCTARLRTVGIGALLGLTDFRGETFRTALHARYLQDTYPEVEISVSFPRIQPQTGGFMPRHPLSDGDLVQSMLAIRLFLPRAGITISTRERNDLRKHLVGLGVTRMSAGSRTGVGGYADPLPGRGQFDVADTSSVEDVMAMINDLGYQPVMKDWQALT